jgi:hypothetical protein
MGVTGVRLKRNLSPTRTELDADLIPDAEVSYQRG